MRGIRLAVLLAVPAMLAVAPPARAAVSLGDISGGGNQSCSVANSPNLNTSAPYVVPSAGVITSWSNKARSGSGQQLRFKVYRGNPSPPNFLTVGESVLTNIVASSENTFAARIPVAAGDFIGLTTGPNAAAAAPDCFFAGSAGDAYFERIPAAESPTGSTATYISFPGNRVNVAATLEPDRDCDGLGDESQDPAVGTCTPGLGGGGGATEPSQGHGQAPAHQGQGEGLGPPDLGQRGREAQRGLHAARGRDRGGGQHGRQVDHPPCIGEEERQGGQGDQADAEGEAQGPRSAAACPQAQEPQGEDHDPRDRRAGNTAKTSSSAKLKRL